MGSSGYAFNVRVRNNSSPYSRSTRQLTRENIRVNVTLCFSANQALLAAKAGAYFVSPFVGRLDDISSDGMQLIREIKTIYDNFHFPTQILVASVRHPMHVVEAARIGAHIATMPFTVLEALLKHPLTEIGLERFLKDWEQLPADAKRWATASARQTDTHDAPHAQATPAGRKRARGSGVPI